MDTIHHWQSYFGVLDAAHGDTRTLEQHAERNPNAQLDRSGPSGEPLSEPKALARVSGSCWIVDCPTGDGGAELVNFDDLRFFCCACRNASWKHRPLEIVVPELAERLEIEQTLLKRPDVTTRNWLPGESIDDLKVDNLVHGVTP